MSQNLALQEVATKLQATSASFWMLPINITSPLQIYFSLLNHCRITTIIFLPNIKY
jgi:hypothetical protein